ncbi:MAG: hypothetical protein ACRDBM_06170 [Sporomusa sp.]
MRDSLVDLNSLLFEELERLSNPDLSDEELNIEMRRSSSMSQIAKNIINNADLVLRAAKFNDDRLDADATLPRMLGGGENG